MKHSVEYALKIQGKTKIQLIDECINKLHQLDMKLGYNIGASKERHKLQERIKQIENHENNNHPH